MMEPLVFIPGLACTEHLFTPVMQRLEDRLTMHVADIRGPDTMEGIVDKVLTEAPSHFFLAGLSMGGYVAMEIALRAPDVMSKLILMDTKMRPDTDEEKHSRHSLLDLAENGRMDEVLAVLTPRLLHPDNAEDADLARIISVMAEETGPEVFVAQERALLGRRDISGLVSQIETPTLVMVGAADAITPLEAAEELDRALPHSRLVTIEGAGHLSTLEQPGAVADALADFLKLPYTA